MFVKYIPIAWELSNEKIEIQSKNSLSTDCHVYKRFMQDFLVWKGHLR